MALGMLLMGGMSLLQGGMQHQQAKQQALMNNLMGEHSQRQQGINNQNARIAGDDQLNTVSLNINSSYDAFTEEQAGTDINRMQARSAAVVNAAASGTMGMSVNDQMFDIERNASKVNANSMTNLFRTINSLEMSRKGIEAGVKSRQTNNIFLPSTAPSAGQALLGAGLNFATNTYGTGWDFKT